MKMASLIDESSQPLLANAAQLYGTDATTSPVDHDSTSASETYEPGEHVESRRLRRTLGAMEAFGILISIVIGSGIFTSPGSIDTNVPSPGAGLIVWLVGGLLAWTGASTVAELGTAIPGEGGVQPYLQYIYGDIIGFLAAWTWVFAIMPATLAILSIVFVDSILSALDLSPEATPSRLIRKLLSVGILGLVSLANCISTKTSTRLNSFFVTTKFVTIVLFVLAGLSVVAVQFANDGDPIEAGGKDWFKKNWFAPRVSVNPDGSETNWEQLSQWETMGHYSAALYGALWAYSGWDKAVYVSAELKDPVRQLPLAINCALPTIIFSFIAAIASYYVLLPWSEVSTTDSVAVTSIARLLGPTIGLIASAMICLVVAGSLLGNSFVAGRMAVSAAHKDWLPHNLGIVSQITFPTIRLPFRQSTPAIPIVDSTSPTTTPQGNAPVNAIGLAAGIATIYIFMGNFRALVTFNGLGEFTFFFLTILGALILRYREPGMNRPYKPPLLVPVAFSLVSGFVVIRGAMFAPLQAQILGFVWLLGAVYYYFRRYKREQALLPPFAS